MKKIISFSLWGDNPKYTIGAIRNAELCNQIYKGWISRFYCAQSVPADIIDGLRRIENTEIIMMNEQGNWSGMMWRFLPCSEPEVEVMISRDTDSRLNLREYAAVNEWMDSSQSFHIMRDHPWHQTEILGGMWGCKYPKLRSMSELVRQYQAGDFWQVDQNFLREVIYPMIKDDALTHDEFFRYDAHRKKFPTRRKGREFVGESFTHADMPNEEHRSLIPHNWISFLFKR